MANFYGRSYRVRVWWQRYIRTRDIVELILAGTAGFLAYLGALNGDSARTLEARVGGAVYAGCFIVLAVHTGRNRQARDHVQAEVVWGLFHHMNDVVFANSKLTRFTLFQPSPVPFRHSYLVPWYRYRFGGAEAIVEAQESRARFKRGQGLAGKAWDQPNGELMFMSFPAFSTRAEFDAFHVDKLSMDKIAADELSGHMHKVRSIFACGMVDSRGKFLGVLSLDILVALEKKNDGNFGGDSIAVYSEWLAQSAKSLKNVLESFSLERRNDG